MTTPELAGQSHFAEYGAIAVIVVLTATVVFALMTGVRIITRVLSGIRTTPGKLSTYECGETPVGPAWFRFNNRFYLVAILFLVFDVEVVVVMPILVRYTVFLRDGHGAAALAKITVFAATLLLGLVFAAKKGDLAWNKSIRIDEGDGP